VYGTVNIGYLNTNGRCELCIYNSNDKYAPAFIFFFFCQRKDLRLSF